MSALVVPSEGVRKALRDGGAVVALETSVLAQGLPAPRNLEAAWDMESAVRGGGAEPAWVLVDGGALRLGASEDDLARLAAGGAAKVSRRDLPAAVAAGGLGATTVSAAVWAASRAGVEVLATGGIGGVHLGARDVSADLVELGRTAVTVVCSGPKSIVDPRATLERLEEVGVLVVGYACDRLPFFVVSDSGLPLEHRADTPGRVATLARTRRELGIDSALLVCNPVPQEQAVAPDVVADAVEECQESASTRGITGKDLTPFLLRCLADATGGASLEANLALLRANAALAAEIAVEMATPAAKPAASASSRASKPAARASKPAGRAARAGKTRS